MLKKIWYVILLILIVIALWQFDLSALWAGLQHIPLWLVGLLLAMQILSLLLVNLQWVYIARLCSMKITFWEMFYANSHGALIDSVTPGVKFGGELTRAVEIKKMANSEIENAVTIVALQKLFSISTFVIVCLLTVGFVNVEFVYYLFPVLLIMIGLFILPKKKLPVAENSATRFLRFLFRFVLFFHNFCSQMYYIRTQKLACVGLFALSLTIWLLYPLKLYILAIHFYPDINIFYISTATFMAYLVAMIPIFPGGLGGFEATMTGMLISAGMISTDALMISLVFRFFTFWLVMLLSLCYMGKCNIQR